MAQFTIPSRNETKEIRYQMGYAPAGCILRTAQRAAGKLRGRGMQVPVGAGGTDPEDFIYTGHINDLLTHYQMTSGDVAEEALNLLMEVKR